MQGILLWLQNKTLAYLDSRPGKEREDLIAKAVSNKIHIPVAYQEKITVNHIKVTELKK